MWLLQSESIFELSTPKRNLKKNPRLLHPPSSVNSNVSFKLKGYKGDIFKETASSKAPILIVHIKLLQG
jgi:hypothetical protein